MRFTIYQIITFIAIFVIAISCTNDNDLIVQRTKIEILTTDKWECVKVYDKYTNEIVTTCLSDDKYEFKEDNECTYFSGSLICYYGQLVEVPSTWSLENNESSLKIILDDSLLLEYNFFKINESVIILENELDGQTVLSKFEPF